MAVHIILATGDPKEFPEDQFTYVVGSDHRLTVQDGEAVELICSPTGWLTVSGDQHEPDERAIMFGG